MFRHYNDIVYWALYFDYCDNCHNKNSKETRYVLNHCIGFVGDKLKGEKRLLKNRCAKVENGTCLLCGTVSGDGLKPVEYYIGRIANYLEIIAKWL